MQSCIQTVNQVCWLILFLYLLFVWCGKISLHATIGFTINTNRFVYQIFKFSQLSKPIPGMFVPIWMTFFIWIPNNSHQINSRILKYLNILWHFLLSSAHACRVERINSQEDWKLWWFVSFLEDVVQSVNQVSYYWKFHVFTFPTTSH